MRSMDVDESPYIAMALAASNNAKSVLMLRSSLDSISLMSIGGSVCFGSEMSTLLLFRYRS